MRRLLRVLRDFFFDDLPFHEIVAHALADGTALEAGGRLVGLGLVVIVVVAGRLGVELLLFEFASHLGLGSPEGESRESRSPYSAKRATEVKMYLFILWLVFR